jgi:hypothetical protein
MPMWAKAAALTLTAIWWGAISGAFSLLTSSIALLGLWPLTIPAVGAPLIAAFGLWALLPPLRSAAPASVAAGFAWGGVALACLALFPMEIAHEAASAREAARVADWRAKLDATPADAPLWRLTPFLGSNVYDVEQSARTRIVNLPSRQSDAEAMFDRDEFPFRELGAFDLDPTPALCDKARASLTRRATTLTPQAGAPQPRSDVADDVSAAEIAMNWLVGMACPCEDQSRAWETLARAYGASDYEVEELQKLRDPKELGRVLDEDPPKFSLLTPKASLHAWLTFADDLGRQDRHRAEALEGARKLDHRTADAEAWLNDSNRQWDVSLLMRFLPRLDLEATPALCAGALRWVHEEFANAYRPPPDNPESYVWLVERLGAGDPLMAVQWLALKGCDADAELSAAESLARAYGDAPQRAEILAALAALHRKP